MPTVSVKNLGSEYRMGKTRLTAEVGSETLAKAREILKREQVTLDDALQEMLSHIVTHDTAPCFKCGDPNPETLQAMAEAEAVDLVPADTIADHFMNFNQERVPKIISYLRPSILSRAATMCTAGAERTSATDRMRED